MNPVRMFRADRKQTAVARQLLSRVVEQARQPSFYRAAGVPDTLDGRFEVIGLHLFLLLRRLRLETREKARAAQLAQVLFDAAFANFDENLREMGVGDLSVGSKVKRMAEAFYGRVAAYDSGLEQANGQLLEAAVRRNLFGTVNPTQCEVEALVAYLRREDRGLSRQDFADLAAGDVFFGPPPGLG